MTPLVASRRHGRRARVYDYPMATESARRSDDRWWLRALLVLQSPRAVFAALRDESDNEAHAREETILAIVLVTGIAGVLMTNVTGLLLNEPEFDPLLVLVWAFVAGATHGFAAYFLVGALVYLGASFAGGVGSYRRARHVLAFAAVPLALTLLVWPVRLAVYGEDTFRRGGSDRGGGNAVFEALEVAALAWALALLVVGLRVVHDWSWPRALAATALPAAVPALAVARAYGVV